ncbi:hypothetical protein FKM82_012823 [Ascaphus truei]
MNSLTQKMSGLQINLGPLKEPLGFIKVLEWIFSIFSFATCGGYSGKTEVLVGCKNISLGLHNVTSHASFMYPFRLNSVIFQGIDAMFCGVAWEAPHLIGDFSSPAQFYVSIGVLAFLYCIGALVLYLGYMHFYRGTQVVPLIDFIITVVFAFMWLVSSSAWAKGLTDIKIATDPSFVIKTALPCAGNYSCYAGSVSSVGSLNVSVVVGFLNLVLWAGNAWFIYKETNLHASPPAEDPANIPQP